jgi:hypothetical protein
MSKSLKDQLKDIVHQQVFSLCDHHEDIGGDEAGIIAAGVERAFDFYFLLATEWIKVKAQENAASMLTHGGQAQYLGSFGPNYDITFYVLDGDAWKIDRTDPRKTVVYRSESKELLSGLLAQFQARRW